MDHILTKLITLINFFRNRSKRLILSLALVSLLVVALSLFLNANSERKSLAEAPAAGLAGTSRGLNDAQTEAERDGPAGSSDDSTKASGEVKSANTTNSKAAPKATTAANKPTGNSSKTGTTANSSKPNPTPATPGSPSPAPTPAPKAPAFSVSMIAGSDMAFIGDGNYIMQVAFTVTPEAGHSAAFQSPTAYASDQPGGIAPSCSINTDKAAVAFLTVPVDAPAGKYTCQFSVSDGNYTRSAAYSFTVPVQ